ncbi:hypothetical protein Hdeb2414_s0007g00245951 [Helianthus debilis subsp. tardiflorus]
MVTSVFRPPNLITHQQLDNRKVFANFMSILDPFYRFHSFGCNMFIYKTHLLYIFLCKYINQQSNACLLFVMLDSCFLDHTYAMNLSLASYEPPFNMYSAIGVTHRP